LRGNLVELINMHLSHVLVYDTSRMSGKIGQNTYKYGCEWKGCDQMGQNKSGCVV
jgi:hypothetical protein